MWAYVDETGNTGNNLFDENQTHFITVAMMTKTNFDMVYAPDLAAIAAKVGVTALHANELGLGKLSEISLDVENVIKKSGARFFVSRLEKRFLAASKVYDTFFDAGENLAVPWSAYWIRHLRMMMMFKVAHYVLTESIMKIVWECLNATNETKSKVLFVEAAQAMLPNAANIPDARSQEIVTSALQWAIANPENFTTYSHKKADRYSHSPNFVAFTGLIDGVDNTSKRWKRAVREIVHDEQSQFGKTLTQWHELYSKPSLAAVEPLKWPGEKEPYTLSKVAGSKFRMATEQESPGLQLVDTVLWVFKRWVGGADLSWQSAHMLSRALRGAYQFDLSFEGVGEQSERSMEEVMNAPLTEEQMSAAREMLETQEKNRLQAMADYADGKLVS